MTGLGGSASSQLTTLFSGQNAYWYVSGSLTQPIFEGGRIRNNYRLSQAQRGEMDLEYRKTILNALKDVSNALVAYRETRNAREELSAQVTAAADARPPGAPALLRRQRQLSGGAGHGHGPLWRAVASRSGAAAGGTLAGPALRSSGRRVVIEWISN